MDNKQRAFIYAFISNVFSDSLSPKSINDLKNNPELLGLIGQNAKDYFENNDISALEEELNIDFTSAFLVNTHPVESSVTDAKHQISTGLENPIMNFYIESGFDVNLNNTKLLTPDHIAIEIGFMQNLVLQGDTKLQQQFMQKHLLKWIPPFLIGVKPLFETPFYLDFLDFTVEFLLSDYENINAA